VVAIAGKRLEADHHVNELLVQHPSGPLTISIQRTEKPAAGASPGSAPAQPQELEIVVEERPMRILGLVMQIGPVVSVRAGSPAAEAGFLPGDLIESIDGQPVGDPLSLGQRLMPQAGSTEPIEFTVLRTDGKGKQTSKVLPVTPILPQQLNDSFTLGTAAIESVGISYRVLPTVAGVQPGSPAATAGLQKGDVIQQAKFIPASDKSRQREAAATGARSPFGPIVLDDGIYTWTSVFTRMQMALPDTKVQLTYERGGKTATAEMLPVNSTTFFDESRGLFFYAQKTTHRAANFSDALSLGVRETKDRLSEVLRVLGGLVTGRIPVSSLSGPIGIMYAAGTFANEGVPKTLIFLTLLSANLAVLNFLPIPALDGGHMLFLAAEWIRGKPVDERLQIRLTIAGILALLSLMVFASAMDIGRFWG
jgi:regulator of sigma E protease